MENLEPVDSIVDAPVAVIAEPTATYHAPIMEPKRKARWPWALLALPLLAIPFIGRGGTPSATQTPLNLTGTVGVDAPLARRAAPEVGPVPSCDGTWQVNASATLRDVPSDNGNAVTNLAKETVVIPEVTEGRWYRVTAGSDVGYLPVYLCECVK
jgi:hypothetical protein